MEMELNEALARLEKAGLICEDTETNDDEIEYLNNEWRDKHNNKASDKELDDIFWKRNKVEKRHLDLEDKIANAQKYNRENYEIDNERIFNNVRQYVANELGYKVYADIDNYNEKAQDQTCEYTIKLPKMMEGDATVYVTISDSEKAVLIQLEHPNYDEQTYIRFSDHTNQEELTTDIAEWISDASTNI